jgi:hypothetical protein
MPDSTLDAEDEKLVTLARATLRRLDASSAAAVRDDTGRTYVAAAVELSSLRLSALQAVVVVAAASGANRLEAAVVVDAAGAAADAAGAAADADGLAAVRELGGSSVVVFHATLDGPATPS